MKNIGPNRATVVRYREASEWLVRILSPDASEKEIDGWLRWCDADDQNLAAFETLQQDWQELGGLKEAPELLQVRGVGRGRARQPLSEGNRLSDGLARWATFLRERAITGWLVASLLGIGVAIALVARLHIAPPLPSARLREVVIASNQEPATLPDGSAILLSAKASAEVDFTGAIRRVALRPGGEAYIKVHHNKARPFVVDAGAMTVTAVGTAFDVRRDEDRVIVTVEEGTIIAAGLGPQGPVEWRAGAGYQVSYSANERTAEIARVDAQRALRWRDGELAYEGAPLETVIRDINRYSTANVVLKDPALGQLRFSGTVFVSSVGDWISALEAKYPVRARKSPSGQIELAERDAAP